MVYGVDLLNIEARTGDLAKFVGMNNQPALTSYHRGNPVTALTTSFANARGPKLGLTLRR